MSRIVSVWLPRWPIQRFLIAQKRALSTGPADPAKPPVDPAGPFVLAAEASGGPCIAALNAAAEALGLAAGERLSDARARAGFLQVRPVEPAADEAALRRLALWATRYTPAVAPWDEANGADGFFLEITGAGHLLGGEDGLLADLASRLARFGLSARIAIAGTAGAAWALSRYSPHLPVILPAGREAEALKPLPVAALRLSADTRTMLVRLGFKRIGALLEKPRAPFAARFEKELLRRLDQALGRMPEPLDYLAPPPRYHRRCHLLEPIMTQGAVVHVASRLMQDLAPALACDGVGARTLQLALYRVDGEMRTFEIGLSLPTQSPALAARLIELRLDRIGTIDAGFGFETVALTVTAADPMVPRQTGLAPAADADRPERMAALLDGLRQRLGRGSVRRLVPVESHIPERSEAVTWAGGDMPAWPKPDPARLRPPLLLAGAEPTQVMAVVPDGPPRRFCWRGRMHGVARTQGPERIGAEWWRSRKPLPTRDYYLVEDEAGRRFWIYREGLYGRESATPLWFVQGLFP